MEGHQTCILKKCSLRKVEVIKKVKLPGGANSVRLCTIPEHVLVYSETSY